MLTLFKIGDRKLIFKWTLPLKTDDPGLRVPKPKVSNTDYIRQSTLDKYSAPPWGCAPLHALQLSLDASDFAGYLSDGSGNHWRRLED
jgi:hypothetical protein